MNDKLEEMNSRTIAICKQTANLSRILILICQILTVESDNLLCNQISAAHSIFSSKCFVHLFPFSQSVLKLKFIFLTHSLFLAC